MSISTSTINEAKEQSKDGSTIFIIYDGFDYQISSLNSLDISVEGFDDVAEFCNGEVVWISEE